MGRLFKRSWLVIWRKLECLDGAQSGERKDNQYLLKSKCVCVCVLKLKHDLKTLSAGDLTLTSTHPADIAGHARVHLVSWLKPASDSCDYKLERKRACLCGTESHLPVSSGIKHLLPV